MPLIKKNVFSILKNIYNLRLFQKVPDKTATNKNIKEIIKANTAENPAPILNKFATLINPLNPKKSTIEITISNIITKG